MEEAWILEAVRTPRGRGKKGKGALTEVHPQELLAQTLNELMKRSGVDPGEVEDVIVVPPNEKQIFSGSHPSFALLSWRRKKRPATKRAAPSYVAHDRTCDLQEKKFAPGYNRVYAIFRFSVYRFSPNRSIPVV